MSDEELDNSGPPATITLRGVCGSEAPEVAINDVIIGTVSEVRPDGVVVVALDEWWGRLFGPYITFKMLPDADTPAVVEVGAP